MDKPHDACMIIADISGYTGYLAGVELDHAQDILADLMGTVVKGLRPGFRLAKLEGDAAFVYAPTETVDGSALQDAIEGTYFAFRRRLRDIRQSSTCECNACGLLPRLDLKFVAHHGPVAKQRMANRDELVGRDVILIHRLLKNSADAVLGGHAYALYTDACVGAAGINPDRQGLVEHREQIDILGEVKVWLRDLETAWQARDADHSREVPSEQAWRTLSFDFDAPRPLVWEYLTVPGRRQTWADGVSAIIEHTGEGRRGTGTVNHCMHGKDAVVEEILDWQPGASLTSRSTFPMPGAPKVVMTDALSDLPDGGTRLDVRVGRPATRDQKTLEGLLPILESGIATLSGLVSREAECAKIAQVDEPALPMSEARFIKNPLVRHKEA